MDSKKIPLLFVLVSLGVLSRCASPPPPAFDEDEWLQRAGAPDRSLLYAPHHNPDGTFFNPWMQRPEVRGGGSWFLRRLFGSKREFEPFPEEKYAMVPNDYSYLSDPGFNSISYAGHASFIVKMDGETIFTDPFFSSSALVVKKKVKNKFDFSQVPRRPVVLISHNHYDHLDEYSVKEMIKKDAVFIVPFKLKKYFTDLGAKEVYELDWWESVSLGTIRYTLLPAQHWSRRIWQKSGTTLWGGFLIQGSKTVYFSGDTGYFTGFREFGRRYDIDYAIMGAGSHEPRWFMYYSHMNVEDFFRAAGDIGAKITIPMHFGIISLSEEPLLFPLYEIDRFVGRNPEYAEQVRPLRVGEFLEIPPPDPIHAGE